MRMLFWFSAFLLGYTYAGYPVLAWFFALLFGRKPAHSSATPQVTLLIPAYNEEAHIESRLRNSLSLDYPKDRLAIVVASDGSTDRTNAIVAQYRNQGVELIAMPENIGKSAMLSRVVPQLRGEVVVFTDASSELEPDALRKLVAVFADSRVGCASGLYRLKPTADLRGEGEGLYWRYETFIKQQESRLHSILGAHGAFYAIRRALFKPLERTAINDDYLIPMRIVEQGLRAVYVASAVAWEREVASVEGEFARRRRIAAGNCQQMVELAGLLHPKHGWVAFTFFSHKVLRTLAPLFLIAALIATPWLAQPWFSAAVLGQALLYGSAWLGFCLQKQGVHIRWFSPPMYFCLGNLAMLAGLIQFFLIRKQVAWQRCP